MNPRGLRRYIDDLLVGRQPRAFRPDDFEAAQIRTAIDLRAAKPGAAAPRPEFLADLHRQLADQLDDASPKASVPPSATRRQVIVGTSAAAAAAVAAVSVDRPVMRGENPTGDHTTDRATLIGLTPRDMCHVYPTCLYVGVNTRTWRAVTLAAAVILLLASCSSPAPDTRPTVNFGSGVSVTPGMPGMSGTPSTTAAPAATSSSPTGPAAPLAATPPTLATFTSHPAT